MPKRKRKQHKPGISKTPTSNQNSKVNGDDLATSEEFEDRATSNSETIRPHAQSFGWKQYAVSFLAASHLLILFAALSTNRERSFLGEKISRIIAPYCQPTNLSADRLPLEITHAQTLEGPYRLLFTVDNSNDSDVEFQSFWVAAGINDETIRRRINRKIAVALFEGNDESVAELLREFITNLSDSTQETITRVRFVATLLLDRDQFKEAGTVSIDEEILLDLKVVKVGDEFQLLQLSEDRRAARSTANP